MPPKQLRSQDPASTSHDHSLNPSVSPSLPLRSDVPKGAKTFGVSGSSEVKIYMVYDPSRVAEPAGWAHWPLDANVDVVVVADTVSKDLYDFKVNNIQSRGGGLACIPCPAISWDIIRDSDPSYPPQHHTATDTLQIHTPLCYSLQLPPSPCASP